MTETQAGWLRLSVPVGALCVCAATDPYRPSGLFFCPFQVLTGLPCPFCGMTRGVASLLRGRWQDGISFHLLSPLVLGLFAGWIVMELGQLLHAWDGRRVRKLAAQPGPWIAFLGICAVYGALRWCGIIEFPRL